MAQQMAANDGWYTHEGEDGDNVTWYVKEGATGSDSRHEEFTLDKPSEAPSPTQANSSRAATKMSNTAAQVTALKKAAGGAGYSLDRIKQIIRDHPDAATAHDGQRPAPLHRAAKHDKVDAIDVLVQAGAHLNATTAQGRTPLHTAAAKGQARAAARLLMHGADADALAANAVTPLHLACIQGDVGTVRCLVQGGADIRRPAGRLIGSHADASLDDDCRETMPIHIAACFGHAGVVCALVEAGGDPEALAEHCPAGRTYLARNGAYAASCAAKFGHVAVLQELHCLGANVIGNGLARAKTPLHFAAHQGHHLAVRCLLSLGADANAACGEHQYGEHIRPDAWRNTSEHPPLHFACDEHNIGAVLELLKAGSIIDSATLQWCQDRRMGMGDDRSQPWAYGGPLRRNRTAARVAEAASDTKKKQSLALVVSTIIEADVKWRADKTIASTLRTQKKRNAHLPNVQRFCWSPLSHHWGSPACKEAVVAVLLVAQRFEPRSNRQVLRLLAIPWLARLVPHSAACFSAPPPPPPSQASLYLSLSLSFSLSSLHLARARTYTQTHTHPRIDTASLLPLPSPHSLNGCEKVCVCAWAHIHPVTLARALHCAASHMHAHCRPQIQPALQHDQLQQRLLFGHFEKQACACPQLRLILCVVVKSSQAPIFHAQPCVTLCVCMCVCKLSNGCTRAAAHHRGM